MTEGPGETGWRKVTFDGRKLWLARNAEAVGHSALALHDHVDGATGQLDPRHCFKGDSYGHAFFTAGVIMRYGACIGRTADIMDGWPVGEES